MRCYCPSVLSPPPLPDVILGCHWSEWTDWSSCSRTCGGGVTRRMRERLPGLGRCDGAAEEETSCADLAACPLESDNASLVVVLGGETSVSRENEHSDSVEVIGSNGECKQAGKKKKKKKTSICGCCTSTGTFLLHLDLGKQLNMLPRYIRT